MLVTQNLSTGRNSLIVRAVSKRLLLMLLLTCSLALPAWTRQGAARAEAARLPPRSPQAPSAFAQFAAGISHTCAVTADGSAKCWGSNSSGQLGDGTNSQRSTPVDVMGLSSGVSAVAAGRVHTCALTAAGGVKCWGYNYDGQLGNGTTTNSNTPVDVVGLSSGVDAILAGGDHTCALMAGGGVKCWGDNWYGQLGDGTTADRSTPVDVLGLASGVSAVALGWDHTCAVMDGGGVKCWGQNYSGQLGDGTTTHRSTPVDVSGLASGVSAVAAGISHTCALTSVGGAKCWGGNSDGQLGNGTTADSSMPVDVVGLSTSVSAVSASDSHTCVLTSGNGVKCWGNNAFGQLGDGTTTDGSTPVDVLGLASGVGAVEAGGEHSCALAAEGMIKCWGDNSSGQLGDGTIVHRGVPMDVAGLPNGVTVVAAGYNHTCAVAAGGGVMCWGSNPSGQLGDGTTTLRSTPIDVASLSSGVEVVTAGLSHTCALISGGAVKCWGNNSAGQLGDGTTTDSSAPVDVVGLSSGVSVISAGHSHTCALTAAGGVKCWGDNSDGQLGDGTTADSSTPVDVVGLSSGVSAVAAGGAHTCALTTGGGVKCWGNNYSGQLGDGTTTQRSAPVNVIGLSNGASAIATGQADTCALTTGGGAKCWGHNSYGQVGDGTTTSRSTPVDVVGLSSGASAIVVGGFHVCALTGGGGVKCWGRNSLGQLGDGTLVNQSAPVDVNGLTSGVSTIAVDGSHTCALIEGVGRAKCWGWDGSGQLGLGTSVQRLTPVEVIDNAPAGLLINYAAGQPGSFFTLTGENWAPGSVATVTVNGTVLTSALQVNETGGFISFLNTVEADAGHYQVTVSTNPSASTSFALDENAPLRVQEGGGETLDVPAGIALQYRFVYLPIVVRASQ